jgi:hypothetical protein
MGTCDKIEINIMNKNYYNCFKNNLKYLFKQKITWKLFFWQNFNIKLTIILNFLIKEIK